MSRSALRNPDRTRTLREIRIPAEVRGLVEPGATAYRMGRCQIIVSRTSWGWHLSISKPDKLPTWEECRDARYELIPDDVTMALLLPPSAEYINFHEFCLQMHEVPAGTGEPT